MANAWQTASNVTFLRVGSRRGAVASCIMRYSAAWCGRCRPLRSIRWFPVGFKHALHQHVLHRPLAQRLFAVADESALDIRNLNALLRRRQVGEIVVQGRDEDISQLWDLLLRQRLGLRLESSVDRADDGMDSGGEVGQVGAEEFEATVELRRRRPANNSNDRQASTNRMRDQSQCSVRPTTSRPEASSHIQR